MVTPIYKGVAKDNKVVLQKEVNLPDGLEVKVIPMVQITHTQVDWLEEARHVREQIAMQIEGYAGESVKEITALREDRVGAIGG